MNVNIKIIKYIHIMCIYIYIFFFLNLHSLSLQISQSAWCWRKHFPIGEVSHRRVPSLPVQIPRVHEGVGLPLSWTDGCPVQQRPEVLVF